MLGLARGFCCQLTLESVQVNGEAIETAQRQLSASYGPVTAADCVLALAGDPDLECGAFQKLIVQPKNLQHGKAEICRISMCQLCIRPMSDRQRARGPW